MNNSTLIQLFKSLDKADRRQLRKVVNSPYFNQRADVIALFEYIDKHIDGGAPKLMKEKVFAAIYDKQKFEVDRFYHTMSILNQIILKYLAMTELDQQTPQYHRFLNKALRKRGSEKMYEKTLIESKTYLHEQPLRNAQFHLDSFMLSVTEEFDAKQQLHRNVDIDLQEIADNFHFYAISEVLRLGISLLSQKLLAKKEYTQPLLNAALTIAEQHLDIPAIATQYYAFQTFISSTQITAIRPTVIVDDNAINKSDTEGVFFQKLKEEINNNLKLFPETELRDLILVAINYCIRRQNRGELEYVREALNLFQLGLSEGILFESGVLSPYTYKNVLMLALKINDYEWAKQFLNDFEKFLPEKERDNLYKYNYAIYSFRKKDYDKAIQLLQEVNLKEVLFNLDARRMLARIYYLHRQKDIGYQKDMYSNFFRILEKTIKSNLKLATVKDAIKTEIEGTQLLAERDWLLSILK
jgi:hypothetical protein